MREENASGAHMTSTNSYNTPFTLPSGRPSVICEVDALFTIGAASFLKRAEDPVCSLFRLASRALAKALFERC